MSQYQQQVSFMLHVKDDILPALALDTTLPPSPARVHSQQPWKMSCSWCSSTNPKSKKKQFSIHSLDETAEKNYLMLDSATILEADREIKFILEKIKLYTTRQVISIKGTQHVWQDPSMTEMGSVELTSNSKLVKDKGAESNEVMLSQYVPVCWVGVGVITLATSDLTQGVLLHVRVPLSLFLSLVFDPKRDKQNQTAFIKTGNHTLSQFGRMRLLDWLFGEYHTLNSGSSSSSGGTAALSSSTTTEMSQQFVPSPPQLIWSDAILLAQSSSALSPAALLIKQYTDFFKRIGLLS
jgi:hypothetical protein